MLLQVNFWDGLACLTPWGVFLTHWDCSSGYEARANRCGGFTKQPAQQQSSQGTPELVSSQNDDDETEPYETDDTPVLTEDDIAQLQEEDVDTEPYTSDHSHFVNVDGTVLFL